MRPIERTPADLAGRPGTAGAITIPCEGSWQRAAIVVATDGFATGICSVCGDPHAVVDEDRCTSHDRTDILAMVARGDYG